MFWVVVVSLSLTQTSTAQQRQGFVSSVPVEQLLAPFRNRDTRGQQIGQLVETARQYRRGEFERAFGWLLDAKIPEQVPLSLFPSLSADINALQSKDGNEALKRAAVDDLILKGIFCRRSPEGLGASVAVNVRTWLEKVQQAGWEVVYKTAVEADSAAVGVNRFAAFSSPTSHDFTAGRFIVWARDPMNHERRGPSGELVVDGDLPQMVFDLAVVK